jgi:hypothetical protein
VIRYHIFDTRPDTCNSITPKCAAVGTGDAAAFRARPGVRRAATLRAALRCVHYAADAAVAAATAPAPAPAPPPGNQSEATSATGGGGGGGGCGGGWGMGGASDADALTTVGAKRVSNALTTVLRLLAVLGQEFCLLRQHLSW